MSLTPTYYEVYPVFTCPCGAEWMQTLEETEYPAGVLCICGAKLKFKTIESVSVDANFKGKAEVKTEEQVEEQTSEENEKYFDDIVSSLVNMGYSKKDAEVLFGNFASNDYCSLEEMFEDILRGVV